MIVVPVFQREKYLRRCFQTIDKQTFFPVEVVFVDDGSMDRLHATLKAYRSTRPHVKVIRLRRNRAAHFARSQAILRPERRYILSLDADDELYPDVAADVYFIAERHRASIVEFDCYGIVNGTPHSS